jgi:AcrR family transcriptional regulator
MTDVSDSHAGDDGDLAQRIVDTAIELGERRGWDAVHLHEIARLLGIGLADIGRHYDQKDAIAEAWFDRADAALLMVSQAPGWIDLDPRERLHHAIFSWLDMLAPHRRLTAEMLRYKFHPEHLHLQALGLMRISRTVQWIREAACLPSTGLRRELEEVALTAIYVTTFAHWLGDESPGAARTHDFLGRLLAGAAFLARAAAGPGSGRDRTVMRGEDSAHVPPPSPAAEHPSGE